MKRQKESRVTSPIAGQPQRLTCPSHLEKIGHRRGRRSTRMAARSKHPKSKRVATKITLFVLDVLAIGSFVVGLLDIVRRYAWSLGRRWGHLSFGAMRRRWVVTGPYSSLVGPLVIAPSSSSLGCHLAHTRRRWVEARAYSSSLERHWALLVFIVGLSYSPSLGPRSLILASFA